MGKSIRSKIKKRFRTAKRQRVDAMICRPQAQEKFQKLQRVMEGKAVTLSNPKNAFKYPDADGACFPQHEIMKPIDFRSQNLPMAGYAFRGNRRKYSGAEAEMMENVARNNHPEMEVLAGGGAILAKTGKRISREEAAILATAAERPEVAAIAMASKSASSAAEAGATPAASSSAGAADADVDMDGIGKPASSSGGVTHVPGEDVPGTAAEELNNEFDHSRRPVFKDDRRAKRVADKRPRSKTISSVSKKKDNPIAKKAAKAKAKK